MKAVVAMMCLLLLPSTAAAFDSNVPRGTRIAILEVSEKFDHEVEYSVARGIRTSLARELQSRGFDAFTVKATYENLEDERRPADYYVEILSSDADNRPYGGVGIGAGNVGLEVSVVVAHVAARLRIYDGRTLDIIDTHRLTRGKTAVVPTAIGGAVGHVYAFIALPFVRYSMYRSAEREVARASAALIAGEIDESADRSDDGRS